MNARYASLQGAGDRKRCYIATQGPLEHTVADFWNMLLQQKVTIIVMLCHLQENGRVR